MSRVISAVTGKIYDDEKNQVVYYRNAKQSSWMINHGAELLDLIPTDDNYLIFVFSKKDHYTLRDRWNATAPKKEVVV